jgi:MoCo/4Fe-4S cofactor protein with predicted Tat translocation signal
MPPLNADSSSSSSTSEGYWRSLDQLAATPEFQRWAEDEFPTRAGELVDPLSRRRFLQVMGASLALAGVGCDTIRWPKENILPFVSRPEHRHPGTTVQYASTIELGGVGTGLLVTSFDGRPIKIEGNPLHPDSLGATDAFTQAQVLEMYDPDRSTSVVAGGPWPEGPAAEQRSTWEAADAALKTAMEAAKAKQGAGLAILTEPTSSPSLLRLKARLLEKLPQATWCEWEPLSGDAARAGSALAFGAPHRAHLELRKAKVVVSLDSDLLHDHPGHLRLEREWADRRRMNAPTDPEPMRLYVAESALTITGGVADARIAASPASLETLALELAAAITANPAANAPAALKERFAAHAVAADAPRRGFIEHAAKDLVEARGAGAIVVGPRLAPWVHALGHLLNGACGNIGTTVTLTEELDAARPSHVDGLKALCAAMAAGQVDTVVVMGGSNPSYTAPADLAFSASYAKVASRFHLGLFVDETGRESTWHLPQAHWLESWGDARAWDGTISLTQPLIAPLYSGRTPAELLAVAMGESKRQQRGYEIVRKTFADLVGLEGDVERERAWRRAVHDGVLPNTRWKTAAPAVAADKVLAALPAAAAAPAGEGEVELVLTADHHTHDGRYANNGWLQELPDPLTKLVWDNALLMSPRTAAGLGVKSDDLVTVTAGAASVDVAVHVLPGVAARTVCLSLGYGRGKAAGVVAAGMGFNAYPLRTSAVVAGALLKATVTPTGKTYGLATTQDHHALETPLGNAEKEDRAFGKGSGGDEHTSYLNPLFREATVSEFKANPKFARVVIGPDPAKAQIWDAPRDWGKGPQWGMSIDLSACTGCNACVIACQAENNIPVVGKPEVARGREMSWLRIDRYFRGDPMGDESGAGADAKAAWKPRPLQVAFQPVTCMQCENAPCEAVCPVGATTHSRDGLNDMAYNRCIGTRYCANNCPYKVRRFNWFWNHHGPFHPRSEPVKVGGKVVEQLPKPGLVVPAFPQVEKMAMNPDVTVRSRGVMEKCTYCVQRIRNVTIKARNEGRDVRDGEVRTACQQSCATQAITFGNLNDPESAVAKAQALDRNYAMLAELNARPRTQYLARVSNPPAEAHAS